MVRTYAVGTKNTIVRSDNHNGIWNTLIPLGPADNEWLDVMTDPLTSDKVFIVGASGNESIHYGIQYSTDAGLTWNLPTGNWSDDPADVPYHEVWVVDTNVIWVVGQNGVVVKSIDGGLSFNKVPALVGLNTPGDIPYTAAIHALDDQVAVVLGSPSSSVSEDFCYAWKTTNGGTTWNTLYGGNSLDNNNTVLGQPQPTGKANGIWISNDQQTIIAATGYIQHRSYDAGLTFTDLNPMITRSGQHLTWYPTYNNPTIFRHTGGFVIQINESTNSGNTWATTKTGSNETLFGAHFYTSTNGYYTNGFTVLSTTNGGVTGVISYTEPTQAITFKAVWTGPPYLQETYFQLTSCCDENDIIYATIIGGTINEGHAYVYIPNGDTAIGCYTITTLTEQPVGTIVEIDLTTELELEDCESDLCIALCEPCLCSRARLSVQKGEDLNEDVTIGYLNCENGKDNYILPADLSWGEYVCAKYFDPKNIPNGYTLQVESTGFCIETNNQFECPLPDEDFSYRLEDCAEIQDDIITNFDLSEVVGQVITLRDENNKPLDGCWRVFQIAYQPIQEDIVLGVYKCYEECEDCLPPAPTPYPLKPRIVDPNYSTGNCDPDIVEGIFCKHAENEHKQVMSKRFGIKDCCPEDEDKIFIEYEKVKLLLKESKNPTPDPCSTEPIINEYYLGRKDGDAQLSLSYTDINGFNVIFTIPACVGICEPVRFCAVRGTIIINGDITYAVNESCDDINNCITNTNLVFVRPCIS